MMVQQALIQEPNALTGAPTMEPNALMGRPYGVRCQVVYIKGETACVCQ